MVPYHHARWEAFAGPSSYETHLVELTNRDEFKVLEFSKQSYFKRHTLFTSGEKEEPAAMSQAMSEKLDALAPDVVCVSGWGLKVSLAAIIWAVRRGVPIVMLSESNEFDEARSLIKEFIKRRLVGLCSAGLAGGSPQADYLVKLGLPQERVFVGYDVVDNRFFSEEVMKLRDRSSQLGEIKSPYFLACARFGKKKNLPGLIRAYSRYRELAGQSAQFDLVIAGDGEERAEVEHTIQECGISDYVHLVGAKGYADLPEFYAKAGAFIHASTTEQWGLVVNEAMASGLPVLVSNRCGCAVDLVKEGENGWTFDPCHEEQMAGLMLKVSTDENLQKTMGERSRQIIAEWGAERFASGVKSAVESALSSPQKKAGLLDWLILKVMMSR